VTPWAPGDCNGDGTHVAATIGGNTLGVAKGVTIVPVRVAGCSGTATASNTVSGIDWILRERAAGRFPGSAVINLSMGHRVKWYEITFPIEDALASAMNAGITVTLSAGNSDASACGFSPARMTQPLTVAATDRSDVRATYSNYGTCVDLFAPGTSIVSAGNSSDTAQATKSGTSMAAPHVAGAVARYLEEHPGEQPGIVGGSIMRMATAAVVANAGTGSPNRLLRVNRVGFVEVPDVLGLSCTLASGEIRAAGLVPQCTGTGTWVKEQSPFAGSMVAAGSTVRLTLESGPVP
jgi:subtilisin family serine protease